MSKKVFELVTRRLKISKKVFELVTGCLKMSKKVFELVASCLKSQKFNWWSVKASHRYPGII